MMIAKLKIATAVVLSLAVIGVGGGVLTHRALADKPAQAPVPAGKDDKKTKEAKEEAGPSVVAAVKAVDAGKHTLTFSSTDAAGSGPRRIGDGAHRPLVHEQEQRHDRPARPGTGPDDPRPRSPLRRPVAMADEPR